MPTRTSTSVSQIRKAGSSSRFHSRYWARSERPKHFDPLGSVGVGGWSTINWATGGAALLLVTATLSAAWSMRPRQWNPQPKGFIFWESIKAHENAAEFQSSLAQQSETDLNTHLAGHLHVLAAVASRKYFWGDLAMLSATAGGVLAAAVLIFA